MLIDMSGEKLGITGFDKAISIAEKQNLDLVQVSPKDATPVVCKIMDYGKHMFEKKKKKEPHPLK